MGPAPRREPTRAPRRPSTRLSAAPFQPGPVQSPPPPRAGVAPYPAYVTPDVPSRPMHLPRPSRPTRSSRSAASAASTARGSASSPSTSSSPAGRSSASSARRAPARPRRSGSSPGPGSHGRRGPRAGRGPDPVPARDPRAHRVHAPAVRAVPGPHGGRERRLRREPVRDARRRRRRRVREVLELVGLWDARAGVPAALGRHAAAPRARMRPRPRAGPAAPRRANGGHRPDPAQGRVEELDRLRDAGRTLLVTTQYVTEAEQCDAVALIAGGRLVALGTPMDLRRRASGGDLIEIETAAAFDPEPLAGEHGITGVRSTGRAPSIVITDDVGTIDPAPRRPCRGSRRPARGRTRGPPDVRRGVHHPGRARQRRAGGDGRPGGDGRGAPGRLRQRSGSGAGGLEDDDVAGAA